MGNQEAIALLRNLEDSLDAYCGLNEEGKTAFRMAIETLSCSEFPNSSDCISRQAAIDALERVKTATSENGERWIAKINAQMELEQLPPAHPEIIRCKDCKHWDTTWQNDYAPNYHYCPMIDGTHRNDFYCAYAERRQHERTDR